MVLKCYDDTLYQGLKIREVPKIHFYLPNEFEL